jgi:hypothetical protein
MCGLTGLVWFYGRWDSWEKAENVLTVAWIFPDDRAEAARAYLTTAVQAPVDRLPPSQLMRQPRARADPDIIVERLSKGKTRWSFLVT